MAERCAPCVLAVDDDPGTLHMVERQLRRWGVVVYVASSGVQALAWLQTSPTRVDLLLTDLQMPHMDGRELAEAARRLSPGLRVALMSGAAHDPAVRACWRDADAILPKPFSAAQLWLAVATALDLQPGQEPTMLA